MSSTSSASTSISSNLCDFCSNPASFACSKCKSAHYCSQEHQTLMWKDYHKIICGKPTSSFYQPDLIQDEYDLMEGAASTEDPEFSIVIPMLRKKMQLKFPNDPEARKAGILKLFNSHLNKETYDSSNQTLSFIRSAIQDQISKDYEAFRKFHSKHYRRLTFYQAADVEVDSITNCRSHEFVVQYFNKSCLQEIERDNPGIVTFSMRKKSVFKLEKILKEWNGGNASRKDKKERREAYEIRLNLWRKSLELDHFAEASKLTQREKDEIQLECLKEFGVEKR